MPPGIGSKDKLEIFIDLMCRKINLEFEKSVEHQGLASLRFIPPPNAMGSHQDPDPITGSILVDLHRHELMSLRLSVCGSICIFNFQALFKAVFQAFLMLKLSA